MLPRGACKLNDHNYINDQNCNNNDDDDDDDDDEDYEDDDEDQKQSTAFFSKRRGKKLTLGRGHIRSFNYTWPPTDWVRDFNKMTDL